MAITKDNLKKFVKSTEFAIDSIEDDSSENTQQYVLTLKKAITAESSIPAPNGQPMKVTSNKINVAADNIEKFMADTEEQDGVLIYRGALHLDVSKPNVRNVGGEMVVTKPAKIWLTAVKFSRSGGNLRQQQTQTLNSVINNMFSGGKVLDLTSPEASAIPKELQPKVETAPATGKVEPEVVPNRTRAEKTT